MGYNAFIHSQGVATGKPVEHKTDQSGSFTIITHGHSKVHQGDHYHVSHIFAAVASAGTAEILIQVPANLTIHMNYNVSATGEGRVQIFEGTTFSGAGTALTEVNNNRRSTNTSTVTATHTPTTTGDGTQILGSVLPGGATGSNIGSAQHGPDEQFMFDESTNYMIRFTNDSASAENVSIEVAYYEVAV